MSFQPRVAFAATLAMLPLGAVPARAQIDYRNLDDERPVVTEDAYPVDRYAFEVLLPFTFIATADSSTYLVSPEIEYGVLANTQVGLKLPLAAVASDVRTEWGLGGLKAYALYNFNTESAILPAISLRADFDVPIGILSGNNVRTTFKAIATRSWGRTRLHINLAGTIGEVTGTPVDALPRWGATSAVDYTLFRQSVLLIGQLAAFQESKGAPTVVTAALGFRWQWRPTLVLDTGITRRLTAAGPDFGLTIGLSHSLAFAGLLPSGREPILVSGGSHANH